ncbi:hypothetical protein J437_LFUL000429 [Ladona fulva]|uniref:dipeptidyl-peptidase I n=1 Tax=Ladona fulva TaxID=123851 RepID=A0A8K0NWU1_LADFU|nr:hypothetical protein J437_LFUL000429 [Ladona fulva]
MESLNKHLFACLAIFCLVNVRSSNADIPAHCLYDSVVGTWRLHEGHRNGTNEIQCSESFDPQSTTVVELSYPNVAIDNYGNAGTWTLIYDQGFEVIVNGRSYFTFFSYEVNGDTVITHCDRTSVGWSHDVTSRNWACYYGEKDVALKPRMRKSNSFVIPKDAKHREDPDFVKRINEAQSSWKAKLYMEDDGKPMEEIVRKLGGAQARFTFPKPAPATYETKLRARKLPESFDWRNVSGVNYVSPVRNQESCGSCFAFASAAMMEARIRIKTNNEKQPVFSTQDIVSCTAYAQGCSGGFAYLIAGKYGMDYGLVEEDYNPYQGIDTACTTPKDAPRHYTAEYSYVGGYYGGSNEENMMLALVENGPVAVGFMVYPDFKQYSGGVYQYTGLSSRFNPFVIVNHAVLVVGYGVEAETGMKYWIVKNSWGDGWGLDGYFLIRRGTNEVGMESIAFEANPIP